MTYLKCYWIHNSPEYPVLMYSELDSGRWERRKVEVYPNGRLGYADHLEAVGETGLGDQEVPPLDEINKDAEFRAFRITRDEFEQVWRRRKAIEEGERFRAPATSPKKKKPKAPAHA